MRLNEFVSRGFLLGSLRLLPPPLVLFARWRFAASTALCRAGSAGGQGLLLLLLLQLRSGPLCLGAALRGQQVDAAQHRQRDERCKAKGRGL